MGKLEFIYFGLGALSLFVGMLLYPTLQRVYQRVKRVFKRKSYKASPHYCDALSTRIDNLEQSIKIRETGRKNKTRKIVIEYLNELKNEK